MCIRDSPDAVQLTQPATKAAVEVLGLHTVQNVDTGLSVLRGRNGFKVLPERGFGVAHQHALIACLRLHPAKLAYRDQMCIRDRDKVKRPVLSVIETDLPYQLVGLLVVQLGQ